MRRRNPTEHRGRRWSDAVAVETEAFVSGKGSDWTDRQHLLLCRIVVQWQKLHQMYGERITRHGCRMERQKRGGFGADLEIFSPFLFAELHSRPPEPSLYTLTFPLSVAGLNQLQPQAASHPRAKRVSRMWISPSAPRPFLALAILSSKG